MGSWSGPVVLFPPNFYIHPSVGMSWGGLLFCSAENIRHILDSLSHIKFICYILVRLFYTTSLPLCPLMVDHIFSILNYFSSLPLTCIIQHLMSMLGYFIGKLLYLYASVLKVESMLHLISIFPFHASFMVNISTSFSMPFIVSESSSLYSYVYFDFMRWSFCHP